MNFLDYLFNRIPGQNFSYYIPMAVFVALLFVGAIFFSGIYKKRKQHDFAFKRLFKKTSGRLTLFGVISLLLLTFRYENIPYFAMRIWLFITIFSFLYFFYRTLRAYKIDYPRERDNVNRNMHIKTESKYLPNKKMR